MPRGRKRKEPIKESVKEAPKVPVAKVSRPEPQISKDPNAPWHTVTERYGHKLKPKYSKW